MSPGTTRFGSFLFFEHNSTACYIRATTGTVVQWRYTRRKYEQNLGVTWSLYSQSLVFWRKLLSINARRCLWKRWLFVSQPGFRYHSLHVYVGNFSTAKKILPCFANLVILNCAKIRKIRGITHEMCFLLWNVRCTVMWNMFYSRIKQHILLLPLC